MRHNVFGRQLSRSKNDRKRLLEGLVRDIILHGTVTTTLAKAKAVQPLLERLTAQAIDGSSASLYEVRQTIRHREVFNKLLQDVKAVSNRSGGYTRIIKIGKRMGDASEMVRIGFVGNPAKVVPSAADKGRPENEKTDQTPTEQGGKTRTRSDKSEVTKKPKRGRPRKKSV
jgi:large subunit ribosomal protein L17